MGDNKIWSISPFGKMLGFNLTLFPQEPQPTAVIYRQFMEHGVRISDEQFGSLLAGRAEAIGSLEQILASISGPNLGPDLRLKIATSIADMILNKSLKGQLAREAPTLLDGLQQTEDMLRSRYPQPLYGPVPFLTNSLPPIGFSLTINFDFLGGGSAGPKSAVEGRGSIYFR